MDQKTEMNLGNHELKLSERSRIVLTGIKKIVNFDSQEFLMESSLGVIHLKGSGLELIRLDTQDGNVKIKGKINSIEYLDSKEKHKEESLLAKLFK